MIPAMKRIIAALAAFAALTPAVAAERRYSVTDFDRIQLEGPYEVVLRTGLASAARAEGTPAALERISIDVQGRTLRIRPNRSGWGGYPGESAGPVRVEVATRDLRTAVVVGAGSLAIDRMGGLRADLSLSGSGRISAGTILADNLGLGIVGSGRMTVGGRAKQLRATVQGSGDLAAANLRADDATLVAETSGSVTVAVVRSAKVTASGAGDVVVLGTPSCTVQARGAGSVRCGR